MPAEVTAEPDVATPATCHLPSRPSWDCLACAKTWPCGPAKTLLLEEYQGRPTPLLVYLAAQYWGAVDDHSATGPVPPDLRSRFLDWVPRGWQTHSVSQAD